MSKWNRVVGNGSVYGKVEHRPNVNTGWTLLTWVRVRQETGGQDIAEERWDWSTVCPLPDAATVDEEVRITWQSGAPGGVSFTHAETTAFLHREAVTAANDPIDPATTLRHCCPPVGLVGFMAPQTGAGTFEFLIGTTHAGVVFASPAYDVEAVEHWGFVDSQIGNVKIEPGPTWTLKTLALPVADAGEAAEQVAAIRTTRDVGVSRRYVRIIHAAVSQQGGFDPANPSTCPGTCGGSCAHSP